ncbi:Hypothetical predicted protein [Paramuricea clavata]|uniref:Uncharacterized protein n=1 Tax=Paramuricea clavata TaxID=317549 RepID=A0A6S7H258_PARCT|nr:Hypothetical predicted protein [Paramuricea clavata]
METLVLSLQECSLYMPNNESSSETSGSEVTVGDMSTQHNALNHFLVVSGIDAITQSKKTFSELQPCTQNTHVTKASEAVAALLEVIAPGNAGALWEATKR